MNNKEKMARLCQAWTKSNVSLSVKNCSGDLLEVACSPGYPDLSDIMETIIRMEPTLDEVTVDIFTKDECLALFLVKGKRYGKAPHPNSASPCKYEFSVKV